MSSQQPMTRSARPIPVVPVADAKRDFSSLIDRVEAGEQILVSRRGKVVLALVPADEASRARSVPLGLAAVAGSLADWDDLEDVAAQVVASRARTRTRRVRDLE
jgi:prevent-host-death family protein